MASYEKPKPLAWFFFVLAFGTCVALGTWQIARLEWKENLIAEIEAARAQPPITRLPTDEKELEKLNFHMVTLRGTWLHEIEYHLSPRYVKNALGYAIITPLQLADGRVVLVNRGWIPAQKKEIGTRRETIVAGRGTVNGMIRTGNERNPFTPPNQKEKNIWFGRDVKEMAAFHDLKHVIPITVDAVGEQTDRLPIPNTGSIKLRNDHLSYIITWFGIAAGVLVIFVLSHKKRA